MGTKKVNTEGVEIIASGYEWICPKCGTYNAIIEVSETVTCVQCQETFEVLETHHAIR